MDWIIIRPWELVTKYTISILNKSNQLVVFDTRQITSASCLNVKKYKTEQGANRKVESLNKLHNLGPYDQTFKCSSYKYVREDQLYLVVRNGI